MMTRPIAKLHAAFAELGHRSIAGRSTGPLSDFEAQAK